MKTKGKSVSLTPDEVIALHLLFKVTPFKETLHRLDEFVSRDDAYSSTRRIYDEASKHRKYIE
jgi:hypothetical protein